MGKAKMKSISKQILLTLIVSALAFISGYYLCHIKHRYDVSQKQLIFWTSHNLLSTVTANEAIQSGDTEKSIEQLQMLALFDVMTLYSNISTARRLEFDPAEKTFYSFCRIANNPKLLPKSSGNFKLFIDEKLTVFFKELETKRNEALLRDLKTNNLPPTQLDAVYKDALIKLTPQPPAGG